jgi:hypothetical protein
MNPIKKLLQWWRGPTDQESLAETAEAKHLGMNRDTIRLSQDTAVRMPTYPADLLPTPDVLDPGSKDEGSSGSR